MDIPANSPYINSAPAASGSPAPDAVLPVTPDTPAVASPESAVIPAAEPVVAEPEVAPVIKEAPPVEPKSAPEEVARLQELEDENAALRARVTLVDQEEHRQAEARRKNEDIIIAYADKLATDPTFAEQELDKPGNTLFHLQRIIARSEQLKVQRETEERTAAIEHQKQLAEHDRKGGQTFKKTLAWGMSLGLDKATVERVIAEHKGYNDKPYDDAFAQAQKDLLWEHYTKGVPSKAKGVVATEVALREKLAVSATPGAAPKQEPTNDDETWARNMAAALQPPVLKLYK